jgi:hypothetical protein
VFEPSEATMSGASPVVASAPTKSSTCWAPTSSAGSATVGGHVLVARVDDVARGRAKGFRRAAPSLPMDTPPLTVEALADYCRTQAGLLAGQAERLDEALTDLLDAVDADIEAARERLDARPPRPDGAATPAAAGSDAPALEEIEAAQSRAAAMQSRLVAIRELAADYEVLAATLPDEYDDPEAALERVVALELEGGAPTHAERETLAETLAGEARD